MPSYPDQITITRLTSTDLGSGSFSKIFSTLSTTKARVQPESATENKRAGRKVSEKAFRFYFPPATDITMKDKIEWDSNTYNIVELETYPNVYKKCIGVLA